MSLCLVSRSARTIFNMAQTSWQLEDQLRWQWSPGQSDEREPRRPRTSHAAAEERWPPEAACETTGAKGQGNGRSNTSGYHGRGYDLRHRGYG